MATYLYRKDCLDGRIFHTDEDVQKALADGWVDAPVQKESTNEGGGLLGSALDGTFFTGAARHDELALATAAGKEFLRLNADGTLVVSPEVKPDEAAAQFLDALAVQYPAWVDSLRQQPAPESTDEDSDSDDEQASGRGARRRRK